VDLYGKRVGPGGEVHDLSDIPIQKDGINKASRNPLGWKRVSFGLGGKSRG